MTEALLLIGWFLLGVQMGVGAGAAWHAFRWLSLPAIVPGTIMLSWTGASPIYPGFAVFGLVVAVSYWDRWVKRSHEVQHMPGVGHGGEEA